MPKADRRRYGSTTLFKQDTVTDANGKPKYVPESEVRNYVGDQGAAKLKESRKTKSQKDDVVSSSDAQETPAARKARLKKAMDDENDELIGKVKTAMTKKGGALQSSNY